jgi:hypothetical protein
MGTAKTALKLDSLDLPRAFDFQAHGDFFRSSEWFRCLHTTSGQGIPRAFVSGELALICTREGSTLHGLTNFYTQEFGPVGRGDLRAIARAIADDHPVTVKLQYLRDADCDRMAAALRDVDFFVRPYFMYENWHVELAGRSFAEYLKGRPSQLRNTIERRRKKLAAAHRYAVTLSSKPDRVNDFIAVYERSWKRPEPYPMFIPALAETCAALGILRLGLLYVDDEPAAAQFWITTPKKALIYKLAYDERWKHFSVGSILSLAMFRQAIEDDCVEEIDYGVGSEPYKRDWMERKRDVCGLIAFSMRTARGVCLAGLERAKLAVNLARRR